MVQCTSLKMDVCCNAPWCLKVTKDRSRLCRVHRSQVEVLHAIAPGTRNGAVYTQDWIVVVTSAFTRGRTFKGIGATRKDAKTTALDALTEYTRKVP